jgi:ABC-type transport system substrate-binding protein
MKKRAVLTGLVMLLMVLSAFAALPAKTASAAAAGEDTLYIAMQSDMFDFNYWNLASNSVWKANVIGFGFESLAGADFDLRPVPVLADYWTFNETTLKVDIYLREGVTFHDGEEMTAEDVKFTYMMGRNGTTYANNMVPAFDDPDDEDSLGWLTMAEINAGIKIIDDYHLEMYMTGEGYGQFFSSTLGVPIMPEHIWNVSGEDDNDRVDATTYEVNQQWGTNKLAAIGTGPWYYADGVTNSYRVMKKYEDYWGKGELTPAGMPLYPNEVDVLYYKIYSSVDTAILALQGGQVDYIAWAITSGRVPALQSDPNIELEYMSDAGYFYMAFNMKKEPMNNITFRKAVSHLIDKARIIDVYMGGFGQEGSTAVSPFFDEWHNPAATKYDYDVELANQMLDDAGYIDVNGDGWREMPDKTLMDKITLLTPPADYDPIRIRAGQMIATNMRDAGINVEAKPIDFNTEVAKMTAFDYQMLILGFRFTGYTECVSVLFDIFGSTAASNNWAFWSEEHPPIPQYRTIGGVSTLADERTQELANEFYDLEQLARKSFNVSEQINLVKQGQEIVADALPANVLYYRVNVEAHNKVWTNWTVFDGTLINAYNLCTLEYAGTGGATGGGAVATLSAGLSTPEKVKCDESVDAYVKVVNNLGNPVASATVTVAIDAGATASPASGTTNANGVFEFSITGTAVGISTVTVNATSGTLQTSDSANVRVGSLGGIGLTIMPEKTVLDPEESISVDLMVTDVNGDPVSGATVTIDPYLLGYGSIAPSTFVTGATGAGTMTYTAPDVLMNQHLLVTLAGSVSHPKYALTNLPSNTLVVYNDAAPDWRMTAIDAVDTTALSEASPTATIDVMAMDEEGNALADELLGISYSNESLLVDPETEVLTDGSGMASFDVTFDDIGTDAAVRVTIGNRSVANAIMETVTLTYSPTGVLNDLYGGYVQYAAPKFIDEWGTLDLTIYVFDSEGSPADGIYASVVAGDTPYGQLVEWPDYEYNSLWDYAGINIITEADEQSIATSGAFTMVWEDWEFYGTLIESGMYEMTMEGVSLAYLDTAMNVYLCPDSWGWNTYMDDPNLYTYEIHGQTTISSSYGYSRATGLSTVIYDIERPVLAAKDAEFDTTEVTVTAYDESNEPIEGADAELYPTGDYGVDPPVNTTDEDGVATFEVIAAAENEYTGDFDVVTRVTSPDMYVVADPDDGSLVLFSQTQLVIEPFRESVYMVLDPMLDVYMVGDDLYVSVFVVDGNGDPYPDLPVSAGVGAVGAVVTPTVMTDRDGMATVVIDTSTIEDASAAMVAVTLATGGSPEGAGAKVMVAVQNMGPDIEISSPTADGEIDGPDPAIMGAVYDSNGIARITLQVDDETPMNVTLTAGSLSVAISEVLEDVGNGEHTVTIVATDSLGVSSEADVTFTVVDADGGSSMLAWAVAAIGWIVAAVVLVMFLMKTRKPSAPAPAGEPVEPEPAPQSEEMAE